VESKKISKRSKKGMNKEMDYREKTFKDKFDCAASHFGVKPDRIVSLKMRDNVNSNSYYRDLVESLKREAGFHCTEINNGLQGKGYLLGDKQSKIIVVEHETGLEVLYIAGSIASLISAIPLVLQIWRSIQGNFSRRNRLDHDIEIRRLDNNGHLCEEHVRGMHEASIGSFFSALSVTANLIENEIKKVMADVKKLTVRVDKIEKRFTAKLKKKKPSKK